VSSRDEEGRRAIVGVGSSRRALRFWQSSSCSRRRLIAQRGQFLAQVVRRLVAIARRAEGLLARNGQAPASAGAPSARQAVIEPARQAGTPRVARHARVLAGDLPRATQLNHAQWQWLECRRAIQRQKRVGEVLATSKRLGPKGRRGQDWRRRWHLADGPIDVAESGRASRAGGRLAPRAHWLRPRLEAGNNVAHCFTDAVGAG